MQGYYAPYIPGWDTHGLPIEKKVQKEFGISKDVRVLSVIESIDDTGAKVIPQFNI